MKREIKFRIKERDGSWHYFDWHYSESWACCLGDLDKETLCEYIFHKDKNQREIYDGDIVNLRGEILKVEYTNNCYGGKFGWGLINSDGDEHTYYYGTNESDFNESEVIGNIYDNPEFLR